jgi:hypothetical protein
MTAAFIHFTRQIKVQKKSFPLMNSSCIIRYLISNKLFETFQKKALYANILVFAIKTLIAMLQVR